MKIGQLIRRKKGSSPYGPYTTIRSFVNNKCIRTEDGRCIPKNKVYEVKIAKFNISDEIVKRLLHKEQTAIIHDLSIKWKKLLDEQPDVIQFRSVKYTNHVCVFEIESVTTVYYKNTPQIRVQLGKHLPLFVQ